MSPIIASAAMAGAATRRQLTMAVPTPARRAGRREEPSGALYAYGLLGAGTVLLVLGAVGSLWMS